MLMSFDICDINMAKSIVIKAKDSLVEANKAYNKYNIYSSICYIYDKEDEVMISAKAKWSITNIQKVDNVTHIYVEELEVI